MNLTPDGNFAGIEFDYALVQADPPVRLHYAHVRPRNPEGPLLLFLHGFGEYWLAWSDYLAEFAELGYHAVAPDLRGFNRSDRPAGKQAYEIGRLEEDIRALIRSFGKDRAVIVGHDWGGAITWNLAERSPEMCEAIVVLNSPHRGAYARNLRASIRLNLKQMLRSWYIYFFLLPRLPEMAIRAFGYWWARHNLRGWAVNKASISDQRLRLYLQAMAQSGALTAGLNYYRANTLGRYGREVMDAMAGKFRFPKIRVPTLVIWGEDDRALEKALTNDMEEFFEERFEITYIPHCSHWVHLERHDEVAARIKRFLGTLGNAAPDGTAGQ